MRASLIVNPESGRGIARRLAAPVAAELRRHIPDLRAAAGVDVAGTRDLARAAVERGDEAVIVLGGDGTANLVAPLLVGTPTALAVLPSGSGNDLAATLGTPRDPTAAARHVGQAVRGGARRTLDLGWVDGRGWFTTVLCSGLDAKVNARANAMRWPRGPRRYELAVLAELALLGPRTVRLVTGCGRDITVSAILVAVGNTPSYGGGVRMCPDAVPDDGLLDVTVIEAVTRRRFARLYPAVARGEHAGLPGAIMLRARSVRVEGDPRWPVYADGEPQGRLPVRVTCQPGALTVVA